MGSPIDNDWEELVRDLARRVDAVAPDWTDHQDPDPGITLAELVAFLGESLLTQPIRSQAALARLTDVVKELDAGVRDVGCRDIQPLTRVRYFHGQLLSAADLQAEQDYVRGVHAGPGRLVEKRNDPWHCRRSFFAVAVGVVWFRHGPSETPGPRRSHAPTPRWRSSRGSRLPGGHS